MKRGALPFALALWGLAAPAVKAAESGFLFYESSTTLKGTLYGDGSSLTGVVLKSGDTMTGPLTIPNAVISGTMTAAGIYNSGTSTATFYYGNGSTLTGVIKSSVPYLPLAGGTMAWNLNMNGYLLTYVGVISATSYKGDDPDGPILFYTNNILRTTIGTDGGTTMTAPLTVVSSLTVTGASSLNMYVLGSSSITIDTATYDIPVSTGKPYWFINLSSSTTLSLSNVVAGMNMTFAVKQSSDSKTITLPTSNPNVRWPNGSSSLSTTTLKIDMVNIACPFVATECFGVVGPKGY